jgi:hypothetical protein
VNTIYEAPYYTVFASFLLFHPSWVEAKVYASFILAYIGPITVIETEN